MKVKKTYVKEGLKETMNQGSYEVGYCRLTVIDATGKVQDYDIQNLFVAFKNGFLDEELENLKIKYRKKKLIFQREECDKRYSAKVRITKRSWFKKH